MKPFIHAKVSVKRWGGVIEDYLPIHNFIDQTKMAMPDIRHRAILHSAFGCFLVEQVFGTTLTNSDGKEVSTRDVAEEHIIEDLGFIPTIERWLDKLPIEGWMSGTMKHHMAHRSDIEKGRSRKEPSMLSSSPPEATTPARKLLNTHTRQFMSVTGKKPEVFD